MNIVCPTCEYHKQRAKIWRDEAYRLAGHPLPRKEKSMTQDEIIELACQTFGGVIKKEERDNFIAFAKLVAEKEREACAKLIAKLTEMLEIQQKLHETAIDMLKPAIEAEREACAKICERTKADVITGNAVEAFNYATKHLADLIRARGQA